MRTTKLFSILFLLSGFIFFTNCNKNCEDEKPNACRDSLPNGELCQAFFQSWFYNKSTNSCELKSYSGCSPSGFQTEAECLACKCD